MSTSQYMLVELHSLSLLILVDPQKTVFRKLQDNLMAHTVWSCREGNLVEGKARRQWW